MIPGSANPLLLAGAAEEAGYAISRSIRLNSGDSAFLSRTPSTAGNRKTWTWAGWVKRSGLGVAQAIFGEWNGSAADGFTAYFNANDILVFQDYDGSFVESLRRTTTQVFRDVSAWYHIVVSVDTTNATAADRVKLYVNGSEVTTFSSTTNPAQNSDTRFNRAQVTSIGRSGAYSGSYYFPGYLADVHFIDGQALDPTSFGEFDADTGIWNPIEASFTSPNNNITWSANVSASTGSIVDAALAFNGSTTSGDAYASSTASDTYIYIDFATALSGTFKLWTGMSSGSPTATVTHSGGSTVVNLSSGENTLGAFTSVTRIAVNRGEAATHSFRAVAVDGIVLIDGATKWGTNGFHLPFSDNSSAAALGDDTSSNGNDWTVNNISVASGAGNDSLVDVPTNGTETDSGAGGEVRGNYCTLNPLNKNTNCTLSNGNLDFSTAVAGAVATPAIGTIGVSSGKWYWECVRTSGTFSIFGIAKANKSTAVAIGYDTVSWGYRYSGDKVTNSVLTSYGATWGSNDVIGVAFDADNGTLTFYKNGVSQGTAFTGLTDGPYFPAAGDYQDTGFVNFGQRPFAYSAPSNFLALCTANLPASTVEDGSDYMDVLLYTGNDSNSRTLSGLGFSPDFLWLKRRTSLSHHYQVDSVRADNSGVMRTLLSSKTDAEQTTNNATELQYGYISGLTSDGFSVAAGTSGTNPRDAVNSSAHTYVAWTWDAGSSTVSNTDGSSTSSVRANPTAGFSIVTYTGNGASDLASATVGHGLGVAPSLIITKNRSGAANTWNTYHVSTGNTGALLLNSPAATDTNQRFWNNTSPTSTVFSVSTNGTGYTNANGINYVAYCFAPVEGYSAFGSYTGNGSADGPFVFIGFRPRFILRKKVSSTSYPQSWAIYDTSRIGYNGANWKLYPNSSSAEITSSMDMDILSNGFKMRVGDVYENENGATYIYACFAENPFALNARAR